MVHGVVPKNGTTNTTWPNTNYRKNRTNSSVGSSEECSFDKNLYRISTRILLGLLNVFKTGHKKINIATIEDAPEISCQPQLFRCLLSP